LVDDLPAQRGSARAVISGATISASLEGLIDFEKERARLEKELAKLASEHDGLEKRLANQDFINRAAADVVASTRDRSAELVDQIARLRSMIEGL
jgi:valyl-tRNA synthetase